MDSTKQQKSLEIIGKPGRMNPDQPRHHQQRPRAEFCAYSEGQDAYAREQRVAADNRRWISSAEKQTLNSQKKMKRPDVAEKEIYHH
jgi:hypothetical protein